MKTKNSLYINQTEKSLEFSIADIKSLIKNFHAEMAKGLAGQKSSLAMIPTFVPLPTGNEKGKFIALDLGGTNFRILEVMLDGNGNVKVTAENKFKLQKKDITGTGKHLFDFIAKSIKKFLQKNKIKNQESLGFTFSFPIKQTSIASGVLPFWNKGFSATNVVGKDVVVLLNQALKRNKINNVKITALVNDTVGTLAAKAYSEKQSDIGIILGTGTNACYPEKTSSIKKWHNETTPANHMIINIEWGNFDKLSRTVLDDHLDNNSLNPGRQRLEKMVSGMYLGELARLIFLDLIKNKLLLKDTANSSFKKPGIFETEHMSIIEGDHSDQLSEVHRLLKKIGISDSTYEDRKLIQRICKTVLLRSATISVAAMSAVILWMDKKLIKTHIIAIDGSLFEKCTNYHRNMQSVLREIFKNKAKKINMTLAKDGSGRGAAVIAAIASKV
jgi:hexokinase